MANIVNQYCTNGIVELTNANCSTTANSAKKNSLSNSINNKNEQEKKSIDDSNFLTKEIKRPRLSDFAAPIKTLTAINSASSSSPNLAQV